jgi:membrane protease YdiL (CAAX protease family)
VSSVAGRGAAAGDPLARSLRGFGPTGIAAILVILAGALIGPLVSAALVLIWAYWSRTPPRALGLVRPRSWAVAIAIGATAGVALKLVMKAVVLPLLGAPVTNEYYRWLAGNPSAIPGMLFTILVGAGFAEELFFRGYLFERLGTALGSSPAVRVAIVTLTTALFALAHYPDQGLPGMEQALFTGLAFGGAFALTGRLWTVVVAHAAFDLVAYALIYWRLEEEVGHLIFG